jgi:hypothetical protein
MDAARFAFRGLPSAVLALLPCGSRAVSGRALVAKGLLCEEQAAGQASMRSSSKNFDVNYLVFERA